MAVTPRGFIPRPRSKRRVPYTRHLVALGIALFVAVGFFSIPSILANDIRHQLEAPAEAPFPITVDPERKLIVVDPEIEAMLEEEPTSLIASVGTLDWAFEMLAKAITDVPGYGLIAGADQKFVTIYPGYRKEEVARAFGGALGWSQKERAAFLKDVTTSPPVLEEGQFQAGTYAVSSAMTPEEVHMAVYDRFSKEILERYSTTTASQVPLRDALIIASLIEREAGGWHDMRDISGIIWNRIFAGMNLQIDATLQYAKADGAKGSWWPKPVPDDKYIKSRFNTYRYNGLPPAPIANPSVAAVVAALNPKKTDCLFYFHDSRGRFHCSEDYEGHVALLKKHYGRGK
ncbi:MAG TPA: endolytic transglycosylase MltG [Candidatus Paceibacterota bacterium]|nr:endolytic transglycosylase MltG [Candidatus Paceibacterota bacterium]